MITKYKLFEWDFEPEYPNSLFDEYDLVLLNEDHFLSYERDASECRGIITDLSYHVDDGWEYDIMMVNGVLEQGVMEHGIERKLTKKEIEQLEIEREANKFNL